MTYGKLDGLFNKIHVPKHQLKYWLGIPEFVDRMNAIADANVTFSDKVVLEVMVEVYHIKKDCVDRKEFSPRSARRAIHRLQRELNLYDWEVGL